MLQRQCGINPALLRRIVPVCPVRGAGLGALFFNPPEECHSLKRLVVPCGCVLTWNERAQEVILCEMHGLQYEKWRGSTENFIKIIATPRFRLVSHIDSAMQC
jgi:hypothetical protein